MKADVHERAARIKLLLMDCDGVLTDGRIWLFENGEEQKGSSHRRVRVSPQAGVPPRPRPPPRLAQGRRAPAAPGPPPRAGPPAGFAWAPGTASPAPPERLRRPPRIWLSRRAALPSPPAL